MINVSFKDLTIGSDLPPPRTASRSDTASAFATLMDEAGNRQDAPAKEIARERAPDSRDQRPEPTRTKTGVAADRQGAAPSKTESPATAPKADDTANVAQSADTDRPKDNSDSAAQPNGKSAIDDAPQAAPFTEQGAAPTETTATTADKPQPRLDVAATTQSAAPSAATQATPVQPAVPNAIPAVASAPQGETVVARPAQAIDAAVPTAQPGIDKSQSQTQPQTPAAAPSVPAQNDAPPAASAATRPASTEPLAAPVPPTSKVTLDTLFAATMLAQSAPIDSSIVVPPAIASAATSSSDKSSAILPPVTEPSARPAEWPSAPLASDPLTAKPSPANGNNQAANGTPSTQGQQLSHLLGSAGAKIDFTPAEAPAPSKPMPALANGMIAQLSALQQTEGQTTTASRVPAAATGLTDSLAAPGSTPTQTATAIAATPVIQPVADEQRSKFAPADNLVLNAPAPATGAQGSHSTAAEQIAPGKAALPTPPVADQVAVHIAKAASEGSDKITIKLKPATLGQIEVQLDVAPDGRVHAVIAADKAETLDLLQRDARALERALGDAGLRTDSGSLSFNLRGQGQPFGNSGGHPGFGGYNHAPVRAGSDIAMLPDAARIGAYANSRAAAGGVDIRV